VNKKPTKIKAVKAWTWVHPDGTISLPRCMWHKDGLIDASIPLLKGCKIIPVIIRPLPARKRKK